MSLCQRDKYGSPTVLMENHNVNISAAGFEGDTHPWRLLIPTLGNKPRVRKVREDTQRYFVELQSNPPDPCPRINSE